MKKFWNILAATGALVIIAFGSLFGNMVGRTAGNSSNSQSNSAALEKALLQASNQANASLPMMVDKDTRLDSTMPGPGKQWTYMYTLINLRSSDVTQQQLRDAVGPSIRNGVCTSKDMAVFVKGGVKMIYRYRGSDGGFIGDIVVNPDECQ